MEKKSKENKNIEEISVAIDTRQRRNFLSWRCDCESGPWIVFTIINIVQTKPFTINGDSEEGLFLRFYLYKVNIQHI